MLSLASSYIWGAPGAKEVPQASTTEAAESGEGLQGSAEAVAQQQVEHLAALRTRLLSPAGETAAQQLVQGGEFESAEELTSEVFLRRWLVARRWDVDVAFNSIVDHAAWRVAKMPEGSINEADIANELAADKVFQQGCDKRGRGVAIVQVRKHNSWQRDKDELERLCCYVLDAQVAAANVGLNPGRKCVCLLDLTDMGLSNMDVNAMQQLFQLLSRHYVETLGAMYYYNPPAIFWGVWNTLSPIIPERTRRKIKVINPSDPHILLDEVGAEVLPKEYGGTAELRPLRVAVQEMRAQREAAAAAASAGSS